VLSSDTLTPDPQDDPAVREAQVFARYLVGRPPPAAAVARYRDARRTIWADGATTPDPVLAFVRRHAWSVAPLDAASSLVERSSALHAGVLTVAILRTRSTLGVATDSRRATCSISSTSTTSSARTSRGGAPLHARRRRTSGSPAADRLDRS
jgi:hypothetical protein